MGARFPAVARARAAALAPPHLASLPRKQLQAMRDAGLEIVECQRVLANGGLNIVGELLRGAGTFLEYEHYPHDDVFDAESHAQYYYHAHRGLAGEHGHFHTFLRAPGMPPGVRPLKAPHTEPWPSGDEALAHLISIAMDVYGAPIGLFAPNRWVAGDTWYPAHDVIAMLDHFCIDHANPSWPVNRWLSAMFILFRPYFVELLIERDRVIEAWRRKLPIVDVLEHRDIEILAQLPISVESALTGVEAALAQNAD
ncbi:MAG: hypothetical protein HY017_27250 [Betaproteobacteria bacterium]|nr:hypothetical protein [Betaproteobacteria bacterium]